uniref:Uncharacterized protein n=1 Tax=Echeneis naucrates TaxID=173247 RepID=A0A665U348_ECHNA
MSLFPLPSPLSRQKTRKVKNTSVSSDSRGEIKALLSIRNGSTKDAQLGLSVAFRHLFSRETTDVFLSGALYCPDISVSVFLYVSVIYHSVYMSKFCGFNTKPSSCPIKVTYGVRSGA